MASETKTANTRPAVERRAFVVSAACATLSIGRSSLYNMAKRGEIRLIRIAGRTLVPASEIARLLGEAA